MRFVEGCAAFTGEMGRRAIFVVSDGTDTASSASARTVMQRAAEANVAITQSAQQPLS